MFRDAWCFSSAGRMIFGWGSAGSTGEQAKRRGYQRAFLISDVALVRAGIVDRVHASLIAAGIICEVSQDGEAEPAVRVAEKIYQAASSFQPDVVIGIGGGSNMDLAKVVATRLAYGDEFSRYFGSEQVPGGVIPLICIPTTSGTGSEVSHAAVLTDETQQLKVSILSEFIRPTLAIVDPELTISCPPRVTADSGIDALTHAIEAYTAVRWDELELAEGEVFPYFGKTPIGDCLAERAIELIGKHLVRAVKEPSNREAREGMSLGATLAGMAFSNCAVALVHALEYPLGAAVHCSHGAGNGLLLPYVMRYNLSLRIPEFARIAQLLGEETAKDSPTAAAQRSIQAVERLRSEIGIPTRLRDLGTREEQLPGFAAKAISIRRLMRLNARQPTEAELLCLLQEAF